MQFLPASFLHPTVAKHTVRMCILAALPLSHNVGDGHWVCIVPLSFNSCSSSQAIQVAAPDTCAPHSLLLLTGFMLLSSLVSFNHCHTER